VREVMTMTHTSAGMEDSLARQPCRQTLRSMNACDLFSWLKLGSSAPSGTRACAMHQGSAGVPPTERGGQWHVHDKPVGIRVKPIDPEISFQRIAVRSLHGLRLIAIAKRSKETLNSVMTESHDFLDFSSKASISFELR
jgi:hypothetical protein